MAALTEWLQLMLAEIARKREERERAGEEELRRRAEGGRAEFTPECAPPECAPTLAGTADTGDGKRD